MRRLLAVLVLLFACASPSAACSTKEGYKVPTNFELVQKASVIVLARVRDVPKAIGGPDGLTPKVTLEPIKFLKGSAPADQLKLLGWQAPVAGVPIATTLSQSHFSTGLGACVRQFYQPGELVVAMFEPNTHQEEMPSVKFVQLFEAFARVVETVDGPEDIWMHAAQKYVALQAGPAETLKNRIAATIAQLNADGTAEGQAIAADLQYQLTRESPSDMWGNASTPVTTLSAVYGHTDVGLYCLAGTPPGMMFERPPSNAELVVGGKSFTAIAASPTPFEAFLLKDPVGSRGQPKSLLRLTEAAPLIEALRTATEPVQVRADGKTLVSGRPLDALVRWAGQCEKLQSVPAPTDKDLRARSP